MSSTRLVEWLKSNWYFPLLLIGIVLGVLIGKSAEVPTTGVPAGHTPTGDNAQSTLQAEFARAKGASEERQAATPPEKTPDTIIAEHTAKLEEDPEPDDAAALLSALGNLHKQKKQDYAAAARYYEQVIENYPEWPGIKGVYHQLMTCYSNLDDQVSLRLLYRKMVETFPPESNEYLFAKDALGE